MCHHKSPLVEIDVKLILEIPAHVKYNQNQAKRKNLLTRLKGEFNMEKIKTQEKIKKLGGCVKVSKIVGVSPQAVAQWKKIPPEYCLVLAEKFKVEPCWLRPDVYGRC